MFKAVSDKFSRIMPEQIITVKSVHGERHLHLSGIQRLLIGGAIVGLIGYSVAITGVYAYKLMTTNSLIERRAELSVDYEGRIRQLVAERNALAEDLNNLQSGYTTLVAQIGEQQSLIFEAERENVELGFNIDKLRRQALLAYNRAQALDLQVEAQKEQISSGGGDPLGLQNGTLDTMSSTLAATAQARDDARAEAERLRVALEANISAQEAAAVRRNDMLAHLEEAVDLSLSPMQKALQSTGLNVDSLLREIRRNYSGVGGLAPLAEFQPVGDSAAEVERLQTLKDNLEQVSLMSTAIQQLPMANPVHASHRNTSGFGYRRHPIYGGRRMHEGVDMAAPRGTGIYAPGDGVVTFAGWNGGYGKTIKIRHAAGVQTLYAHLSDIDVSVGDRVRLDQRIGDMGSTGNSTGSHIHYEVVVNGNPVDPEIFMKAENYVR